MKKFILSIFIIMFIGASITYACFDTYLFVNHYSMVYPHNTLVVESLGEYSWNDINNPLGDTFFANFNAYYGVGKNFSMQAGMFSKEGAIASFQLAEYGIKGALNLITKQLNGIKYTVDGLLSYRSSFSGEESGVEISLPNMFYKGNNVLVVHPVFEQSINPSLQNVFGGHLGLFHMIKNSVVGIGAEYDSPQSGSMWNKRLIEGEAGISLFLGSHIGGMYIQSEFAKGLANSRDFGYAVTFKLKVK